MKFVIKTRVALAGTAAMLALTGCGGSSDSSQESSDAPYQVLISAGLSAPGVMADNSKTSVLALKAGADAVNSDGGILGRKIEVTVVDDAADATQALTALRKAIASDSKPDLYVNSGPSTVAAATLPVLNQNEILSFNIGPTENSSNPTDFPLNFDLSPSPADYADGFAKHIEDQGYKSVGILHDNTSYGQELGEAAKKALAELSVEVKGNEEYNWDALDMTPSLLALKEKAPEALMVTGYGASVGYLLENVVKIGWDVPLMGDISVAATDLISTPAPTGLLGTPAVENLVVETFASTNYEESDDLLNSVIEGMSKSEEIPSTLITAYNYDALPLVFAAAESVGSIDDSAALAEALIDPEVLSKAKTVIFDSYHFNAESHSPNLEPTAFKFVKPSIVVDGQFGH